ncbi:hypothetical protein INR49_032959 [Caranx melampygus]|nr:hypothetical protein INR49_032959 [Caranx melampygus]
MCPHQIQRSDLYLSSPYGGDLDDSYHNDESQSEEFSYSENILYPRCPAHTGAVHPGAFGGTGQSFLSPYNATVFYSPLPEECYMHFRSCVPVEPNPPPLPPPPASLCVESDRKEVPVSFECDSAGDHKVPVTVGLKCDAVDQGGGWGWGGGWYQTANSKHQPANQNAIGPIGSPIIDVQDTDGGKESGGDVWRQAIQEGWLQDVIGEDIDLSLINCEDRAGIPPGVPLTQSDQDPN